MLLFALDIDILVAAGDRGIASMVEWRGGGGASGGGKILREIVRKPPPKWAKKGGFCTISSAISVARSPESFWVIGRVIRRDHARDHARDRTKKLLRLAA